MTLHHSLIAVALGLVSVSALAAPPGVTVDKSTQQRLGIATAPLAVATRTPGVTSFAHVLDPTPLLTLDSDLEAASAIASASAAEAQRARVLAAADATVARKTAEAATAQARGDAARLLLLRRRLTLEWGTTIASMSGGRRAALIADLAAGRSALLRIDVPAGVGFADIRTVTVDLGGGQTASARLFGDARAADPRQAVAGKLAIVRGALAGRMAIGLTMPVHLVDGAAIAGVFVPAIAVLRQEGRSWTYVRRSDQRFDRMPLSGTVAIPGGLLASGGVRAGEHVVIRGAAKLYTAEQAVSAAGE